MKLVGEVIKVNDDRTIIFRKVGSIDPTNNVSGYIAKPNNLQYYSVPKVGNVVELERIYTMDSIEYFYGGVINILNTNSLYTPNITIGSQQQSKQSTLVTKNLVDFPTFNSRPGDTIISSQHGGVLQFTDKLSFSDERKSPIIILGIPTSKRNNIDVSSNDTFISISTNNNIKLRLQNNLMKLTLGNPSALRINNSSIVINSNNKIFLNSENILLTSNSNIMIGSKNIGLDSDKLKLYGDDVRIGSPTALMMPAIKSQQLLLVLDSIITALSAIGYSAPQTLLTSLRAPGPTSILSSNVYIS